MRILNITPAHFQPVLNKPSFGQTALCALKNDRFEKSEPAGTDFLNLTPKEMSKKVYESINEELHLGTGSEACVYKIKNTDYVIKIPLSRNPKGLSSRAFEQREKTTRKDKINHIVARYPNNITIMKNIEGFPLASLKPRNISNKDVLKQLSKLPVKAYHGLFKQICHAKDYDMIFDCDATNVILNPKKKTLTAIDFYPMDKDYPETVRPLKFMAEAICTSLNKDYNPKCAGLILLGAIEELKPKHKPCLNISEFKFADYIQKLQDKSIINPCKKVEELKQILTECEALKFIELFSEMDVTDDLNDNISKAQELIKELF